MSGHPWTVEQAEALRTTRDALLVANAGTGKTTTVVGKIRWLLGLDVGADETGAPVPPCEEPCQLREIAAITFTEKAAADLKRKLREEIEASDQADVLRWQIDQASIGTIHSFCGALLREYALRLGIDPTFRVLEEREARTEHDALLRDVILELLEAGDEDVGTLVEEYGFESVGRRQGAVGLARAALRDVRWYQHRYSDWCEENDIVLDRLRERLGQDEWDERDRQRAALCVALHRIAVRARDRWQEQQDEQNVRDFDALILDARRLLSGPNGGAALAGLRARYRILIIDEFQDTDAAQRDIAFLIGGDGPASGDVQEAQDGREGPGPQLFLVGDPKQSIYRFRGADISVWNQVEKRLGEPLRLTRNFRSDPAIIDFVNEVAHGAVSRTGEALAAVDEDSRVEYAPLEPDRPPSPRAGVDWLLTEHAGRENARRQVEAPLVARRILELRERGRNRDGEPWRFGDMALLYRSRTGLEVYERELRRHGIPYYISGQSGLSDRQEIDDLVNALRAIHDRHDELALFGFLRSPFVGLRDDVLARIRLLVQARGLDRQARAFLDQAEVPAPESERADVAAVELEALRRGLDALDRARRLAHRVPLDELLRDLIERTGYANHLLLFDGHDEVLANVETFLRLVEQHRDVPLDTFLAIWEQWDDADAGLPQEPLNSERDDVVTLMTFHSAKGLEWPVVFLIDTDTRFYSPVSHNYWSDAELGPALPGGGRSDRGPRDERLAERHRLHDEAEAARLLYVAMTRARERLILAGPPGEGKGYGEWLARGRDALDLVPRREIAGVEKPAPAPHVRLEWMDRVRDGAAPALIHPIEQSVLRTLTSATEEMMKERRPDEWAERYVHGIEPRWRFARDRADDGLPPTTRGTLVHAVLEEIQEEAELARILEERIGELDAPELEPLLQPGTRYRRELEQEILRVVRDPEWAWYTDGTHYRELGFLHRTERAWRVGSFDLYRPARAPAEDDWIIDFKTNAVDRDGAAAKAREYRIQARVYREAAAALAGPVRFRLHFTRPNVVVELEAEADEGKGRAPARPERRQPAGPAPRDEQTDLFG